MCHFKHNILPDSSVCEISLLIFFLFDKVAANFRCSKKIFNLVPQRLSPSPLRGHAKQQQTEVVILYFFDLATQNFLPKISLFRAIKARRDYWKVLLEGTDISEQVRRDCCSLFHFYEHFYLTCLILPV